MDYKNCTSAKSRMTFLLVLAIGISLLLLWVVADFVVALFMAAVLAGLAHPVYDRATDLLKGRRAVAAILTVVFTLAAIIIPLLILIGIVVNEATQLGQNLEPWMSKQAISQEGVAKMFDQDPLLRRLLPYQDQIVEKVGKFASETASFVAHQIASGAQGTAEFGLMLFITLYAMFFFLKDGPAALKWTFAYLPLSENDKQQMVCTFNAVARATIKGSFLIGVIQGTLAGIAFVVVGIPAAVLWGAIMAVLSILPGIGSPLVWVPAVIYLAIVGEFGAAAGLAAWCGLVVCSIDNFLRPVLVGKEAKMPDLLILLTTLGGVVACGAAGLVIGPVIGALFFTIWELWGSAIEETRKQKMMETA